LLSIIGHDDGTQEDDSNNPLVALPSDHGSDHRVLARRSPARHRSDQDALAVVVDELFNVNESDFLFFFLFGTKKREQHKMKKTQITKWVSSACSV